MDRQQKYKIKDKPIYISYKSSTNNHKRLYDISGYAMENLIDETQLEAQEEYISATELSASQIAELTNIKLDKDASFAFGRATNLESLSNVEKTWDTSNVTTMNSMFYECQSLKSLDVSSWDTSNVSNISYIFYNCGSLESLDLSNWNIDKISSLSGVFNSCYSLSNLNISGWNTSNVTNMSGTFSRCNKLNFDRVLRNLNTSNVTDMSYTFSDMDIESLDLSMLDVSKVTTLRETFARCSKLEELNISTWDTSNVEDGRSAFQDLHSANIIFGNKFNTSKMKNMSMMFYSCKQLPEEFPIIIDCSSITSIPVIDKGNNYYEYKLGEGLCWMFIGTPVKKVKIKNLKSELKPWVSPLYLKNVSENEMTIEFIN